MAIKITRLESKSHIALDMSTFVTNFDQFVLFDRTSKLTNQLRSAGFIRSIGTRIPKTWEMDRLERHTFSHRIVDQLPLRAELATPLTTRVSRSEVIVDAITIVANNVIVLEGRTTVHITEGLDVADVVDELRVARRTVDTLSETIFREVAKKLRKDSFGSSEEIIRGLVEDRSGRFDIYDFDAQLSNKPTSSWELLLSKKVARQELVGLLRLSRPGVWRNYSDSFCKDFLKEVDLGKRTDDLWAVYGRRLFRRHPEAVSRQDVQDYFEDVGIIVSVLLASEASLETIAERFTPISQSILRSIGTGLRNAAKVNAALSEAVEVLPTVLSPSRIHKHFGHRFFQDLSSAIESTLGLSILRNSVQQQVIGFLGAASAVAANTISISSLRTARRVEWLTVATVILSIAVFMFSLIQFFKLFKSGGTP